MARTMNRQPAYLEIEGDGSRLECWFNPKDYTISKTNNWNAGNVVGAELPPVQFTGGSPRELTLDLLFDASDSDSDDVEGVTKRLFKMMAVPNKAGSGKNKARPPKVKFGWGKTLSFDAVPKQLSVQYTQFRPDGAPVRARAKLTLMQVGEITDAPGGKTKRQNPTTTGLAGLRAHVVRDGDSLQSIAYRAYGDAGRWRTIAEANGIDDPLAVPRGVTLSIPRLGE